MSGAPGTSSAAENGQYDFVGKPQSSMFIVCMNVINTLTHLLLGAVAISAIAFANQMFLTTSLKQHIYLCVTGYIILMSQAVLALNPQTGWTSSFKHRNKKIIHWVMQITGSILALTGSIIRIVNINNHLETTHGILGVVAMILTTLSLVGGIVNLYSMNLKINPIFVKICHSCFGSLTLIVAFIGLILAFNKDIYRLMKGDTNADLAISLTVFALVGTLMSACLNTFKRMCG